MCVISTPATGFGELNHESIVAPAESGAASSPELKKLLGQSCTSAALKDEFERYRSIALQEIAALRTNACICGDKKACKEVYKGETLSSEQKKDLKRAQDACAESDEPYAIEWKIEHYYEKIAQQEKYVSHFDSLLRKCPL